MKEDPFKEYLKESEPTKKELGYLWYTAVGLQKVDGLNTSEFLHKVALDNIEGNITLDKANELVKTYYIKNKERLLETKEADIVAANITKILADKSFTFSSIQFLDIHKQLFCNVYSHAGKIRDYNITKKEWVLNGDTITYGGASLLKETLEYDFRIEKEFDYKNITTTNDFIKHIAKFIANLWQIHVFAEGNTRTCAVFLIKYLNKFGYDVTNDIFAKNAWYFRNALVRANYTNVKKNIYETTKYLELFLRNLILGEQNVLKNRFLHIDFEEKVDIEAEKVDIEPKKVDINTINVSNKLMQNILCLYNELKNKNYFSRKNVVQILDMSNSGASKLIKTLCEMNIIVPVKNHGKGNYNFNIKL